MIGVPKTIDNDLGATDQTFGFDTALHVATDAIDRLHTTAESHNRILVVEVMGRSAGWIALHCGLAGGADVILIPEMPFDIDEVCRLIKRRHARGRYFSIVVVAEGATPREGTTMTLSTGETDEFGHPRLGGMGQRLEREIEVRTGYETRATVLGHVQRGGTPTAFDRVLATRLGLAAMDAAHEGRWGMMTALHATEIRLVPLAEAVKEVRRVPWRSTSATGCCSGESEHPEGRTPPTYLNGAVVTLNASAIDELCVDTIRTLSMDAVQKANSGHPGTPMALAPVAYVLFTRACATTRTTRTGPTAIALCCRAATPRCSSTRACT